MPMSIRRSWGNMALCAGAPSFRAACNTTPIAKSPPGSFALLASFPSLRRVSSARRKRCRKTEKVGVQTAQHQP